MENIIARQTVTAKKIKAKTIELQEIKQRLDDIDNKDLFEITFEEYRDKTALMEYHEKQYSKLVEFINSTHSDIQESLEKQISSSIKKKTDEDEEISKAFSKFEEQSENEDLRRVYEQLFNEKMNEMHQQMLSALSDYFEAVGSDEERKFKIRLQNELPTPISIVDIETRKESERLEIPHSYANRGKTISKGRNTND